MSKHFEDLWEEAEQLLKQESSSSSASSLVQEIKGKISVYSALDNTEGLSNEDRQRLKNNALGKVLLTITQLSSKDNINVYAALKAALDEVKISIFESKYK